MSKILVVNGAQPRPFARGKLNAEFFAMHPLPTFPTHDAMKNVEIRTDLARFEKHLKTVLPEANHAAA